MKLELGDLVVTYDGRVGRIIAINVVTDIFTVQFGGGPQEQWAATKLRKISPKNFRK